MLRLVAYHPDGVLRFPLLGGEQVVGSAKECDIRLDLPGVVAEHAVLRRNAAGVEIVALDRSCAVVVNGKRSERSVLQPLDEIRLGQAVLLIEDSAATLPDDFEAPRRSQARTSGTVASPGSLLEFLSRLSAWVVSDSESRTSLDSMLRALLDDFGGGALFLFEGRLAREDLAVRLAVASDDRWLGSAQQLVDSLRRHARPALGRTIGRFEDTVLEEEVSIAYRFLSALDREYVMVCALQDVTVREWSPELGLAAVADLLVLGMVHHVGRYEPILPGRSRRRDLALAPNFVVGPSEAMRQLVSSLRALVESDAHLVLRGEPGTRREEIARTLHQSGPRSKGPFVLCHCDGASSEQLEADLFGAQVEGKAGPVRREGKLALAHRGTLYLDSAHRMPLGVQGRLVRALRSGRLEGPAEGELVEAAPRVIAASDVALRQLVGAGRFRLDLALLLGQVSIEVPALRERLADLPLIVQTCVNRFSHETGKRVRGITVSALSALSAYPFPGNLLELENAVRQMVYLVEDGAPLDLDHLPSEIRHSPIAASPRIDERTDVLDLRLLVGNLEHAAIREALRRTAGNRSQAARLLGVSRNGLAQKLARHGG